jgi:hypothetical protein
MFCAHLGTAEGDTMEVRFEPKPTWGPNGYKGRYMAGREPYFNYGKNICVGVKLSKHRPLPNIILSEIIGFYGAMNYSPNGANRQQYNLAHVNENEYLAETDTELILSTVQNSELKLYPDKQYINFTLVYASGTNYVVPLIDPISGSPFFQMCLHCTLENNREYTY